jgi:hypothetical protein
MLRLLIRREILRLLIRLEVTDAYVCLKAYVIPKAYGIRMPLTSYQRHTSYVCLKAYVCACV